MTEQRLREVILRMARERGPSKSVCPSDAARAVGGDNWRDLMDRARDAARDLAKAGEVEITQGDDVVDTQRFRRDNQRSAQEITPKSQNQRP